MIENKKKALKLKEWGNDAFKKKKYELAENFYTKALQLNLDSRPSWTNRAICRNAMKKHEDALADCISALSINPKCIKVGVPIDLFSSANQMLGLSIYLKHRSNQLLKKEMLIWVWVNLIRPKSVTNHYVHSGKNLPPTSI